MTKRARRGRNGNKRKTRREGERGVFPNKAWSSPVVEVHSGIQAVEKLLERGSIKTANLHRQERERERERERESHFLSLCVCVRLLYSSASNLRPK